MARNASGTTVAAAPTHASTVIAVTEINTSGVYGWTAPTGLPVGTYRIILRLQAGVSPANTDNIIQSKRIRVRLDGRVEEL